ncbi:MAG: tRNA preQ1(34) S-adenosylmethionine ribosyltransferase-isomerase QueA [Ruminococcus sp.]|jgi:S-adenosylmethionine:tRNA ribosyltransferase-isomerase|nr:tRNA preQ1(34) S-adenosylmethionine ribosyltransferase-isomerase QueA [Ruminococcus sp.]
MLKSDFFYELPEELIAQTPIEPRNASRMLTCKKDGTIFDDYFFNLKNHLKAGDLLILNNSRVIPARIFGVKQNTFTANEPAVVEFLLLRQLSNNEWETIVRPGKRAKTGAKFIFGNGLFSGGIVKTLPDGNRVVHFEFDGIFLNLLEKIGQMPLPPYIHEKLLNNERYQTVYSEMPGSAAAPTAGLHFTPDQLRELNEMGIDTAFVTLHIGLGTFRPVKEETIENHKMHSEYFEIPPETAEKILKAKADGRRVISVGTTATRTLESAFDGESFTRMSGDTDIFITPGYTFKCIDGLITNFHLPESTLIMLVSAFLGYNNTMNAYKHAVKNNYRFFSFGDAMLIL